MLMCLEVLWEWNSLPVVAAHCILWVLTPPFDTSELKSAQYENWEYPSSREGSAEGATFQMEEKISKKTNRVLSHTIETDLGG